MVGKALPLAVKMLSPNYCGSLIGPSDPNQTINTLDTESIVVLGDDGRC